MTRNMGSTRIADPYANATDFEASSHINRSIAEAGGRLRVLDFTAEQDVPLLGPPVPGRMTQFNVWKFTFDSVTERQRTMAGRAVLRRWHAIDALYNKTGGQHDRVLWLREDQAWVRPLHIVTTADVVVRPCKPFAGISDKVLLFNKKAAANTLGNLIGTFLDPRTEAQLRGTNPEQLLSRIFALRGLAVDASWSLYSTDALRRGAGEVCYKKFYMCDFSSAPVLNGPFDRNNTHPYDRSLLC